MTAVLVGGPNRVYRMTPEIVADFAAKLAAYGAATGGTLLVTPSRRTGARNIVALQRGLEKSAAVIWNGTGDNPYFGYLSHADQIVATCDSVNMVSEACATGKPVYVFDLPGGSAKFKRFHETLRSEDINARIYRKPGRLALRAIRRYGAGGRRNSQADGAPVVEPVARFRRIPISCCSGLRPK